MRRGEEEEENWYLRLSPTTTIYEIITSEPVEPCQCDDDCGGNDVEPPSLLPFNLPHARKNYSPNKDWKRSTTVTLTAAKNGWSIVVIIFLPLHQSAWAFVVLWRNLLVDVCRHVTHLRYIRIGNGMFVICWRQISWNDFLQRAPHIVHWPHHGVTQRVVEGLLLQHPTLVVHVNGDEC